MVLIGAVCALSCSREQGADLYQRTESLPKDSFTLPYRFVEPADVPETGTVYGRIDRVWLINRGDPRSPQPSYNVDVDLLLYTQDDDAIAAAQERGEAEVDIGENGDTTYFVYNDYFVVNDRSEVKKLTVAAQATVEFWYSQADQSLEEAKGDVELLITKKTDYRSAIFRFELHDGIVTRINEVYIP